MYQVISFTCLALYFHLPYLRRILISKFLMKLKPFKERYTKTQPHKTSTRFIPVSNFFGTDLRIQDLHSDPLKSSFSQCFLLSCGFESGRNSWGENDGRFDLTDLASSPTSPDVGGSKVVVVASSIEPSTDLRAVSLSSLPLGTWNISVRPKKNVTLNQKITRVTLPSSATTAWVRPPSITSQQHCEQKSQGWIRAKVERVEPLQIHSHVLSPNLFLLCLLVLGLLNSIQTQESSSQDTNLLFHNRFQENQQSGFQPCWWNFFANVLLSFPSTNLCVAFCCLS